MLLIKFGSINRSENEDLNKAEFWDDVKHELYQRTGKRIYLSKRQYAKQLLKLGKQYPELTLKELCIKIDKSLYHILKYLWSI